MLEAQVLAQALPQRVRLHRRLRRSGVYDRRVYVQCFFSVVAGDAVLLDGNLDVHRFVSVARGGVLIDDAGRGGSYEERAAAKIGGLVLGDFHVRIHVALRSVPAFEAVRISEAARMIAF